MKENQPSLLADIKDSFQMLVADSVDEQIDCGHGRVETRRCSVLADLSLIDNTQNWASLQAVVRIQATRFHKPSGKQEHETRYYITSLKPDAQRLNAAIRQHWGIENKLHWVLDVAFGEDQNRKRAGNAAQNFSLLNRIALNLIRKDKSTKGSVRGKRLQAAWDDAFLWQLLVGGKIMMRLPRDQGTEVLRRAGRGFGRDRAVISYLLSCALQTSIQSAADDGGNIHIHNARGEAGFAHVVFVDGMPLAFLIDDPEMRTASTNLSERSNALSSSRRLFTRAIITPGLAVSDNLPFCQRAAQNLVVNLADHLDFCMKGDPELLCERRSRGACGPG